MLVDLLLCVALVFVCIYFNSEIKNSKKCNEILELGKQKLDNELNRIKAREKYVNVILDFEKEEENK